MARIPIRHTSRYAPIRYEATRPYAVKLGRRLMAAVRQGGAARQKFIGRQLPDLFHSLFGEFGPGIGQAEAANIQLFADFHDAGRIIFDVHRLLSLALGVTDIGDIPCGVLTFPTERFYLHFGPDSGISDEGLAIEGVFVQHRPAEQRLALDLIPAGFYANPEFWTLSAGESPLGVTIDLSRPERPLVEALEQSVEAILANNRRMLQELADLERRLTEQYGQLVRVPLPEERLDEKLPALRQALQLVANACFYIASMDDVQEGWEPDAPAELRLQAESAEKAGTRRTAENTLANNGYLKVRYVGRHYAATDAAREVGEAIASGRTMPRHFRRGHQRNQAYGPEWSLRKAIFIPPVVVNPHRTDDSPGRVYEVRPPESD